MKLSFNTLCELATEDESAAYALDTYQEIGETLPCDVYAENGEYVIRDQDGARIS